MFAEAATTTSGGDSVGLVLRNAREKMNMELDEIATRLNLTPGLINRIESDKIEDIPVVYLRGYVRSYSQVLGLDSGPLLSALPDSDTGNVKAAARERSRIDEMRTRRRVRNITILMALLALLLSLSYAYIHRRSQTSVLVLEQAGAAAATDGGTAAAPAQPAAADDGGAADDADAMEQDAGDDTVYSPPPWHGSDIDADARADTRADDPELQHQVVPAVVAAAVEPPAAGPDDGLQLLLSGNCWIEIKDGDGTPLLTKMGSAGERIRLDGKHPFSILLGNSSAVNLWFEGEQVDLAPHSRGLIARLHLPQ